MGTNTNWSAYYAGKSRTFRIVERTIISRSVVLSKVTAGPRLPKLVSTGRELSVTTFPEEPLRLRVTLVAIKIEGVFSLFGFISPSAKMLRA